MENLASRLLSIVLTVELCGKRNVGFDVIGRKSGLNLEIFVDYNDRFSDVQKSFARLRLT